MAAALMDGDRGGLIPIGMEAVYFHARPSQEKNTFWATATVTHDSGIEVRVL